MATDRRTRAAGLALLASVAVALCSPSVEASPKAMSEVEEDHPGHRHAAFPNLVGARVGYLSVLESPQQRVEYAPGILFGLSYERTVIHEWLELEIAAPVAFVFSEERIIALPIDVHFKKPFHPSPRVSPYVAVGPAFDVQIKPEAAVFFGASIALGTYVWPASRVGLDIEVDFNLAAERWHPVDLPLVAVGPVFRL
ncbi:MAG: hypothetical protein AAF721_16825 [Myxococcota bacterium]